MQECCLHKQPTYSLTMKYKTPLLKGDLIKWNIKSKNPSHLHPMVFLPAVAAEPVCFLSAWLCCLCKESSVNAHS